jgi:hypothetical protein
LVAGVVWLMSVGLHDRGESPACNTGGFVEIPQLVAHGVDDLTVVWDYSDSPTLGKVLALPHVSSPYGRKLGGPGAFDRWQHALGHYATFSERTRRLSVQLKLAEAGQLVEPSALAERVQRFAEGLAIRGVEPYGEPFVRRVDVTADLRCEPAVGRLLIDAMAAVRLDGGRRVEVRGDPRSTVYFLGRSGRAKQARVYDRNLLTGQGEPYGLIRLEAQCMFEYGRAPLAAIAKPSTLAALWLQRFGADAVAATVRRIDREVQTVELARLVAAGVLRVAELERMSAFLDLERAGIARNVYGAGLYAQRRRDARSLGLAVSDPGEAALEVELAPLLKPARAVWQLDAPDGVQAGGIEAVIAAAAGADHDMVEQAGEDRVLAAEVEQVPLFG